MSAPGRAVLRGALRGQRRRVATAALLGSGHQTGEALVPVVIGVVIDVAVATGSGRALLLWLAVLGVVFVVLSFSYRFGARVAERASEQAAHDLRLRLTRRVLDARGGAERGRLPGALAAIASGDAERVGAAVGTAPFGVACAVGLAVSAAALLNVSVPLGLLVLLGTPPLLYLTHLVGRPLTRRSEGEQERAAQASGIAADLVAGLRVVKGLGAEAAAADRYRTTSRASLAAALHAARARAGHDGTVLALTGGFIATVALTGAVLAMRGQVSVGGLVAAVGLAQFLHGPFRGLGFVNGAFAQARASAGRIAEVLDAPWAVPDGTATLPAEPDGALRLRDLHHGSLRGVDADIAPGTLVGVVAPDPATASDLLACLSRDVAPERGSVQVDGVDAAEIALTDLRRAVLVAEHGAALFEASLADNVAAAARGPLAAALAAATADEVASALPHGMATELTERGRSLSGGQRQRVALARALAADPPVLVLHDPTTAVDAVTEARVARRLAALRRGRTTVLVTTSPALLDAADTVVLLEDGTVTARGSHADLLRTSDSYRRTVLA
ncbi:ABC transporter ATP-binding protein [Nocardiopsis sp. NPDC049922]|uniref:ABC transporter ATP-binding protein n=1 Tax=Nocardiopsis sp. NPDC049922 TaxID=3155157 RepID=UPI0033E0B1D7